MKIHFYSISCRSECKNCELRGGLGILLNEWFTSISNQRLFDIQILAKTTRHYFQLQYHLERPTVIGTYLMPKSAEISIFQASNVIVKKIDLGIALPAVIAISNSSSNFDHNTTTRSRLSTINFITEHGITQRHHYVKNQW